MVNAYRKALQSLWTGVCTVYVRVPSPTPDPATGRTVWAVEAVAEAVPCRLSFETLSETQDESSAAKVTQSVKLFLDPAVPLPAGSKLTVTQNGVTGEYVQSGEAAVYSNHKGVPLELFERWA